MLRATTAGAVLLRHMLQPATAADAVLRHMLRAAGTGTGTSALLLRHMLLRGLDMVLVVPLLPNVGGGPKGRLVERVPARDGIKLLLLPVPGGGRAVEAAAGDSPRRAHAPVLHIEGRVVGPRRRGRLPPIHSWNARQPQTELAHPPLLSRRRSFKQWREAGIAATEISSTNPRTLAPEQLSSLPRTEARSDRGAGRDLAG